MTIPTEMVKECSLYSSEGSFRSLWQKYFIFREKLVLKTIFRTVTIPFDEFEKAEIRPPNIKVILKLKFLGQNFKPAVKIDLADFYEHLAVYKKTGLIKILLITPDNLRMFKEYLDRAVEKYRQK